MFSSKVSFTFYSLYISCNISGCLPRLLFVRVGWYPLSDQEHTIWVKLENLKLIYIWNYIKWRYRLLSTFSQKKKSYSIPIRKSNIKLETFTVNKHLITQFKNSSNTYSESMREGVKNTHECKYLSWETTKLKCWCFWSDVLELQACTLSHSHRTAVWPQSTDTEWAAVTGPYLLRWDEAPSWWPAQTELDSSSAGVSMHQTELGRGHGERNEVAAHHPPHNVKRRKLFVRCQSGGLPLGWKMGLNWIDQN